MPHDALLVIAGWLALGVALAGLGSLVRRVFGTTTATADAWFAAFWLGWAATIAVLQAWQLVLPIDHRTLAALTVAGTAGLVLHVGDAWRPLVRGLIRHAPAVAALGGLLAWLSLQALHGVRNGDSGLYHLPTVEWHLAHRLPPGLGNLAAPFAYNQSFFLWVALLELGPLAGRASHVANGVFVAALVARIVLAISRVVRARDVRSVDAFYALLLPAVLPLFLDLNLTSPSPDFAVWTLGIVLVGELVRFLTSGMQDADLLGLALLAACGPPVKLSLGGVAVATALVAGAVWLVRVRPHPGRVRRVGLALLMVAFLVPGLWMVRGVVLSGFPLYPSTALAAHVDWAVPRETVVAEAKLIRYWNGVEDWWLVAFRDPVWLWRWLPTLDWLRADVLTPLAIALVAGVLALGRTVARRGPRAVPPLAIVVPLASLAFCIAAAPRARYGASAYWILASLATWSALPAVALSASRVAGRRVLVGASLVATVLLLGRTGEPLVPALRSFEPSTRATVTERRLASGLVVLDPGRYMQCWDAPVPCTPFPNDALRLRRPGDIASGFTVAP